MENVMGKVGFWLHDVHDRDFQAMIRLCGLRMSNLSFKCVVWKMKIRQFVRSDDVRSWWQHLEWDVVRRCPTRRFWIVQHRGRDVVPNVLRHGQVWPIVTHFFSLLLVKYRIDLPGWHLQINYPSLQREGGSSSQQLPCLGLRSAKTLKGHFELTQRQVLVGAQETADHKWHKPWLSAWKKTILFLHWFGIVDSQQNMIELGARTWTWAEGRPSQRLLLPPPPPKSSRLQRLHLKVEINIGRVKINSKLS